MIGTIIFEKCHIIVRILFGGQQYYGEFISHNIVNKFILIDISHNCCNTVVMQNSPFRDNITNV